MWGPEFTTKAATLQGDSTELVPSLLVVGLVQVATSARVLVHEVLDRGVQAVVLAGARRALHVLSRIAKADACGRSFAALSTQVSTIGLLLRLVVPRCLRP